MELLGYQYYISRAGLKELPYIKLIGVKGNIAS